MTDSDYIKQAEKIDPQKAARMQRQFNQLWALSEVTCHCKATVHFMSAFRCLYCGEFFCMACAEVHFGQTQRDWMKQRHPDVLKQLDGEAMVEYYKQPESRTLA